VLSLGLAGTADNVAARLVRQGLTLVSLAALTLSGWKYYALSTGAWISVTYDSSSCRTGCEHSRYNSRIGPVIR